MTARRVLCGIDYGTKRIGLAIGSVQGGIASPLVVVEAQRSLGATVASILAAVREFDVDAYVVGLPLNMDGTEGEQARSTRRFGEQLARASDKPVDYWDERLSSHCADEHLAARDLTRKKKRQRHDAVAAQVILQAFLDADDSS